MLNLTHILQLVVDRFDQKPLSQHQPIPQPHQARLHVASNQRDQLQRIFHHEARKISGKRLFFR
jgi:hypothetical protein